MNTALRIAQRLIQDKRSIKLFIRLIGYIAILGLAAMVLLADRQFSRQDQALGTITTGFVIVIFGAVLFLAFRISRSLNTARRRAQFVTRTTAKRAPGKPAITRAEAEAEWTSIESQRQNERSSRSLVVRITRKTIRLVVIALVSLIVGILVFIALLSRI